jgi:50S ribosomal protein L16 3-hydroxylase
VKHPASLRLPDGLDAETFLRDYWQRRPLLMRAALPAELFQLEADELAGLACEPECESRILIQERDTWTLRHGPFDETTFASLPEAGWTLLVQDVDKFVPEVADLIDLFDFVPTWRIDDIMISYATHQGGVGPHSDAYDVFLMQGQGRRRWRISTHTYTDEDLLPGLEQRILARFDTTDEWVLDPGDILYLPPGLAHWGIAEGECMTWSLGFRTPNRQELAADWFQHLVGLADEARLRDPPGLCRDSLAELGDAVQAEAAGLLAALPGPDSEAFRSWLGCHLTEPKPQFQITPPDQAIRRERLGDWIASGGQLRRHPCSRLAWRRTADGGVELFSQGDSRILPGALQPLVKRLCERRLLDNPTLAGVARAPDQLELLLELVNEGLLEADTTEDGSWT